VQPLVLLTAKETGMNTNVQEMLVYPDLCVFGLWSFVQKQLSFLPMKKTKGGKKRQAVKLGVKCLKLSISEIKNGV